jgi:hypothetical protein
MLARTATASGREGLVNAHDRRVRDGIGVSNVARVANIELDEEARDLLVSVA